MDVILLERVEKLGQMGEVVQVKPGYARNFLLPKKKALRATKANMAQFDEQKAQLEADNLKAKSEAEKVAEKLDGLKVIIIRAAGESGQLYGSVSSRDISEAVTAAGVTIGRQQVVLDRAIKSLGLEDIKVVLHPEVSVTVVANIARSEEEAERQAELGRAVTAEEEEAANLAALEAEEQPTEEALAAVLDEDALAQKKAEEEAAAAEAEASADDAGEGEEAKA